MLIEVFVTGSKNQYGKAVGFIPLKKDTLEESIKAAAEAFEGPDQSDNFNKVMGIIEKKTGIKTPKLVVRSEEDQKHYGDLTKKLASKVMTEWFNIDKNADNITSDLELRYPHQFMMDPKDKAKNERITELLRMAESGVFKDPQRKDEPDVIAAKNELIEHHRKMLHRLDEFNLKDLAEKQYTDEELVENYETFYNAGMIGGQFDNVRHEFKKWGIEDEECSKLMDAYTPLADYFTQTNQRYAAILDPNYKYLDPLKNADTLLFASGFSFDGLEFEDHANNNDIECDEVAFYSSTIDSCRGFAVNAELNAARAHLQLLGVEKDNIGFVDPKTGKVIHNDGKTSDGKSLYDVFLENPGVKMVDMKNPKNAVELERNLDMKFTRHRMTPEYYRELKTQKPVPEKVSGFGAFLDKISHIFTNHYPRQEKYDRQMQEYNEFIANSTKTENELTEIVNNQKKKPEAEAVKTEDKPEKKEPEKQKTQEEIDLEKEEKIKEEVELENGKEADMPNVKITSTDIKSRLNMKIDERDMLIFEKDESGETLVDRTRQELYNACLTNNQEKIEQGVAKLMYICSVEKALSFAMRQSMIKNEVNTYDLTLRQCQKAMEPKVMTEQIKNMRNSKAFDKFVKSMNSDDVKKLCNIYKEYDPLNKRNPKDTFAEYRNDPLSDSRKAFNKYTKYVREFINAPKENKVEQPNPELQQNKKKEIEAVGMGVPC